jgi:hypothetical protein
MRILHLDQFEVLLPIGPLFFEGSRTVADLDPAGRTVRAKPGFSHVSQVLARGYGTFAQSSVFNRLEKSLFAARPDTCAHQIPHDSPVSILCAAKIAGRSDATLTNSKRELSTVERSGVGA